MKARKFYGSVSRHVNTTRIFQHVKLQPSLPRQKVMFSNSLTGVLSTSVAQEQVLRRVEVPVQNDCVSKWAPGQIQQVLIKPWHLLGPIQQLSFRTAAQPPSTCHVLHLPCSVPSQEGDGFSLLLSYRAEVGISYFLSALIFSPVSHTVLQTPETKITKGDFLGTLWHVYGFTDLNSGYS